MATMVGNKSVTLNFKHYAGKLMHGFHLLVPKCVAKTFVER